MKERAVKQHWLDNGLHLLGEINPENKSSAMGFFVKTGARDETLAESGVSHFLEHMMFKGTKKRSALEVTYELGNIGVQANAYTSEEATVYYGSFIPEYFAEYQELLSDMLRPALDQEEFDTEKNVILEEIALYLDRPHFFLYEQALADYYQGHSAGNSVLGSIENIQRISRDEMSSYFDRRYSPSNMTLVASGVFNWDTFVADAEKYCSSWENFPTSREVSAHVHHPRRFDYTKENLTQAHVMLMTDGADAQEEARYPMAILATIFGDSSGSKLYWELVDKGLAESAGCDNDEKDGTGCFTIFASTLPNQLDQVVDIVRKVFEDPKNFTDAELERAKTKLASKIVLSGELPMARLMALGNSWMYREELHSLSEVVRKVRETTRADIEEALAKYPLESWTEFRLLPA